MPQLTGVSLITATAPTLWHDDRARQLSSAKRRIAHGVPSVPNSSDAMTAGYRIAFAYARRLSIARGHIRWGVARAFSAYAAIHSGTMSRRSRWNRASSSKPSLGEMPVAEPCMNAIASSSRASCRPFAAGGHSSAAAEQLALRQTSRICSALWLRRSN